MARVSSNDFYLALLNVWNMPQEKDVQKMMSRTTKTTLPVFKGPLKLHVVQNTMESILKQQQHYNRGAKALELLLTYNRARLQPFTLGKKD